MTTFEIPTLSTERLRLRAFRASDLDSYATMQAKPEAMRYMVMGRTSTPAEVWRTMLMAIGAGALRGYGMWACERIDGDGFIGSVGIFHPLDWPEPEIAYSLDQQFWHQGLATEAAGAARDWLFKHFPFSRLRALFGPTMMHRNASWDVSVRFANALLNCAAARSCWGTVPNRYECPPNSRAEASPRHLGGSGDASDYIRASIRERR